MKRLMIILMAVALGVAVSSCSDQSFNEVQETVELYDMKSTTNDAERIKT